MECLFNRFWVAITCRYHAAQKLHGFDLCILKMRKSHVQIARLYPKYILVFAVRESVPEKQQKEHQDLLAYVSGSLRVIAYIKCYIYEWYISHKTSIQHHLEHIMHTANILQVCTNYVWSPTHVWLWLVFTGLLQKRTNIDGLEHTSQHVVKTVRFLSVRSDR